MPLNTGVTGSYVGTSDGGGVLVEIYYNPVLTLNPDTGQLEVMPEFQPIRNVGGVALKVTNTTGRQAVIRLDGPSGPFLGSDGSRDVKVPVDGFTATKAQLANAVNIQTRADVTNFTMSSPEDALRKP
jgi:hypothetical protein